MRKTLLLFVVTIAIFSSCSKDNFLDETGNANTSFIADMGAPFLDPANTRVLIVGVLTYEDEASLGNFDTYHRKDQELMQTFIDYGVPEENIIGLFDENATRAHIYKSLHDIALASDSETNFVFYFAGHGFNGWDADKSSIYFANHDIKYLHPDKTGFNINFLENEFRAEFPGNSVVLLGDCCKSGGLIGIAESFGSEGKKAVGLTSCYYTEWSTGNWTFTQKIIDALKGDGLIDIDNSGTVTLGEMADGVARGLKYIDRQKSFVGYYNCGPDAVVADVTTTYPEFTDPNYQLGQYVFADFKKTIITVEITGKTGSTYQARYYNYADYATFNFTAADFKTPYFVQYTVGENVELDNFTDKPGILIGAEGDFYEIENPGGGQILWRLYEKIIADEEIPAMILDATGTWVPGQILDQTPTSYYVTYTDKNFQWDEWVDADHVTF